MKFLVAILLLVLSARAATAQQAELTALLRKHNVPGMQLIYSKNGKVTTYSLGHCHAATPAPITARTTFQAASLGKVVLAYVALRLVDQHRLDLDKPLLDYGPYPRLQGEPRAGKITARMVLTHTSGLPNWAEYPLGAGWKTSALRLRYAPDSCWNYSGEGYVFLQKALEHLTGQTWEALARQQVFQPLQMTGSSFVWQPRFAADVAFGHDAQGRPTNVKQFTEPVAAYSLLTTATDYHRFVLALMSGTGLQPATARLLTTAASEARRCGQPATPTDAHIAWACGLGLATTSRGPAQWHWGNNGDFQGFFMTFPARRESLLLLTNSANGLALAEDVLHLFVGPGQYYALPWLAEEK